MPDHARPLSFATLVHADWSMSPSKRWMAIARGREGCWQVAAPSRVGEISTFLDLLFGAEPPLLAGFDFPIGLPAAFGRATGFRSFPEGLAAFGTGAWQCFYEVAETPDQISPHRPFYPRRSTAAARQQHLLQAHGVASIDDLRRACERRTASRRAACPLFWTLGGNQVGKAAIAGWREVIGPAMRRGARLWPFDGTLAELARGKGVALAETYPAEAYGHVGAAFAAGESKRRQQDRRRVAQGFEAWAQRERVAFSPELHATIADGFGPRSAGEDAFDALAGLLGMIEVVDGRRIEAPAVPPEIGSWEGWILGQQEG